MSVPAYYSALCGILDDLEDHQASMPDLKTLREYHQDFVIAKFLSDVGFFLLTQVRVQIIASDSVPSLTAPYSVVLHVFTKSTVLVASPFVSNELYSIL